MWDDNITLIVHNSARAVAPGRSHGQVVGDYGYLNLLMQGTLSQI